jgi:coenzyme F420 hydrogenase subunit beta
MPESSAPMIVGELYAGYADDSIRPFAASGGIVSAILTALLESGQIDGALVSRITSCGAHIVAETVFATTREEILACGGSSYIDTPVLQTVKELAKTDTRRIAVVALPCQVRSLRSMMARDPALRAKFFPVISLFCRGTVNPVFYDDFLRREGIAPETVETIKINRKHVSGEAVVHLHNGKQYHIPFMKLNVYRLAGIHPKPLCAWCAEHIGNEADISVGDIFMKEYKQRPIKHSAFVGWNEDAVSLLQNLYTGGKIHAEFVGWEIYHKKFAKIEKMSNTLASRYAAARIVGQKRPRQLPPNPGPLNPFHSLAWTLLYLNGKLSRTERGRRFLYNLPSPVISLMAYFIKALSRLGDTTCI